MDDTRKRARENDRISELPNSVIDCILDHLPIGDVVRTSILSRKWRRHWTRVGNMVFDEQFVKEIIQKIAKEPNGSTDYELRRSAFIDAICSLLLLHDGPINKFYMRLPRHFNFDDTIDGALCKWVHALSLRGVKELTLDARNVPNLLFPSYIFDCQEMRQLALRNCKVSFPLNIRGFKNLVSLHLDGVLIIPSVLNTLISNCPLLEKLFLKRFYRGSYSVSVCALNLRTLEIKGRGITALSLQNVPNLASLSIRHLRPEEVDEHTFTSFFRAMPNVTDLTFGGQTLTGWATHGFPVMLPTPLDSLNNLSILGLDLSESRHMHGAICILRSSPNLQRLNLAILGSSDYELADAEAFVREWFTEPKYFPSSLSTVTIRGLTGSRPQIFLSKFILTLCPSLEMLNLNANTSISPDAELQMMAELLECHHASSKVKIIFIKGQGKSAKKYTTAYVDTSVFRF